MATHLSLKTFGVCDRGTQAGLSQLLALKLIACTNIPSIFQGATLTGMFQANLKRFMLTLIAVANGHPVP